MLLTSQKDSQTRGQVLPKEDLLRYEIDKFLSLFLQQFEKVEAQCIDFKMYILTLIMNHLEFIFAQ